jgi:hypothetical protein
MVVIDFLPSLARLRLRLTDAEHIDERTQKVHASSLSPLRMAVFAVQPFVSKRSFKLLLDLWHEYKNEQADARTAMEKLAAHDIAGRDPQTSPAYPDDMLRSYFKKFRKEVG